MNENSAMGFVFGVARWSAVLAWMTVLAGQVYAADRTAIMGEPGGAPFIDRPEPGARVVAVAIRAGAWIDAMGVAYQTPDGRRFPSADHGGPGGGPLVYTLEPDERILEITGRYGQYVESIQFVTNKDVSRVYGGLGGATEYRIDVPPNHSVVGFAGRGGNYLDTIGLALAPAQPVASGGQPPTPQRPAALDGPVHVQPNLHDATLVIRLTAPASVQVNLGQRKLRRNECFPASERLVSGSPVHEPKTQHRVTFTGLQMNKDYSYAIRIGGGACESGSFTTSTRLDNNQ